MTGESVLVTGATGQDGWYLIRYLLARGYRVHAQSRSPMASDDGRLELVWHVGDLTDPQFLEDLFATATPSQVYNLAAISRPHLSWDFPIETAALNAIVPHQVCELIRNTYPTCRLFQASSSEMFGESSILIQNEATPIDPRTPYGVAKAYAHRIVGAYRVKYGLHLNSGIMFNHESPRRALGFVSQKIAHAAALLAIGQFDSVELDENNHPILENGRLRLGRVDISRDFGFAGDYVEAMHAILKNDTPDDFVIGTGETNSIADFCDIAFRTVGRDWREHVITDPALIRKVDASTRADPSKLRKLLGRAFKTSFPELVALMVNERISMLKNARR